MKYAHIVRYVSESLWAMMPNRVDPMSRHACMKDIMDILAFRASGGEYTAEEIQARIGDAKASSTPNRGSIAVLPLRGVIAHRVGAMDEASGGMSTERFAAMFRQCLADDSISTIVIDVDSPGGTVQGVPELSAEILAARGRKPVIAVANAYMASAAYWIASAADEIVATPSAMVGSIGVYTAHEDLSAALENEGIKITLISAGKYKVEGNPFEPLGDEAKAVIQARVDDFYRQFVKAVAKGRGVTAGAVRGGYGQGRCLNAADALAAGLVDRIATMDATLARLSSGRGARAGIAAEGNAVELAATIDALQEEAADLLEQLTPSVTATKENQDRDRRFRVL